MSASALGPAPAAGPSGGKAGSNGEAGPGSQKPAAGRGHCAQCRSSPREDGDAEAVGARPGPGEAGLDGHASLWSGGPRAAAGEAGGECGREGFGLWLAEEALGSLSTSWMGGLAEVACERQSEGSGLSERGQSTPWRRRSRTCCSLAHSSCSWMDSA